MPSPADREAQAHEDLDRIARHFFGISMEIGPRFDQPWDAANMNWEQLPEDYKDCLRAVVRRMLIEDTIRVGTRPTTIDQIFGQTSIDDPPAD